MNVWGGTIPTIWDHWWLSIYVRAHFSKDCFKTTDSHWYSSLHLCSFSKHQRDISYMSTWEFATNLPKVRQFARNLHSGTGGWQSRIVFEIARKVTTNIVVDGSTICRVLHRHGLTQKKSSRLPSKDEWSIELSLWWKYLITEKRCFYSLMKRVWIRAIIPESLGTLSEASHPFITVGYSGGRECLPWPRSVAMG